MFIYLQTIMKELSSCHKLGFTNPFIFATRYQRSLIFYTINSVKSNSLSLGCKGPNFVNDLSLTVTRSACFLFMVMDTVNRNKKIYLQMILIFEYFSIYPWTWTNILIVWFYYVLIIWFTDVSSNDLGSNEKNISG